LGRLTLNPIRHLDPFGTLMLLISLYSGFGFGWAKPVPIDPSYYRNHKRGTVLVSLAGPVSNLLLAFVFSFPMAYIAMQHGWTLTEAYTQIGSFPQFSAEALIYYICMYFYMINIGLAVFNILPIPPLDGSKILSAILPERMYFGLMQYERYVGIVFLAIMLLKPGILSTVLSPFSSAVKYFFMLLASPLLNLVA
jgi:Zn-dependent protease